MKNKVRPRLLPCFFLTLMLLTLSLFSTAQTTIDCANLASGPYVPGSSIGIPIKTTEVIVDNTNEYQIYLTNASGTEQLIGTYKGIYTPHVTGTLPAGLAPGTYKIRVKTTKPGTATAYCTITVAAGTPVTAGASASSLATLEGGSIFGWCGANSANRTITLNNTSTAGATVQGILINNRTGVATTIPLNGNLWDITLPDLTDYTFIVRAERNGVVSTKSYTIINNAFNLSLSNYNETSGCIPFVSTLGIPLDEGGIINNYKGSQYRVDWGDGTVEFYSYNQLFALLAGKIKHTYTETSCGQGDNSFKVNITFVNPFSGGSCTSSNIGTDITVFRKPEAKFAMPNPVCVNKPVTITNTSVIGNGNMTSVCQAAASFTWYVNGIVVYTSPAPEATAPNLNYTFTKAGKYEIRLDVENLPCGVNTKKDSICVEDLPSAAFSIQHTGNCRPLVVKTDTTTDKNKFFCDVYAQKWEILRQNASGSYVTAPANYYKVTGSMSGSEPTFTFDSAGLYRIRYTVTSSCDPISGVRDVEVRETKVVLPAAKSYCGLQTLDFSSNTAHKPFYSTTSGNSYFWKVDGGNYSFTGSTSATSQYPKIQFEEYKKYTVTVTFTNECGTKSASQEITFSQPVTATILNPTKDTTVCYDATSIILEGKYTGGAVSGVAWSKNAAAGGTFTNGTTNNAVYTFGTIDKQNKTVTLTYTVSPVNTVCPKVSDDVTVKIYPENKGTDATNEICSGSTLNYKPISSVSTSTFTWTAALSKGSATGYNDQTTPGTGAITDKIENLSNKDDAVVVYTITPYANGCTGIPYKLTITIKPIPQLTATVPQAIICSGSSSAIKLESTVAGTVYTWTSTVSPTGTVTGNTSQTTSHSSNIVTINDVLMNASTKTGTVTYVIVAKGPTGCASPSVTKTIDVRPPVTAANAGPDQKLCKATSATLAGNNPAAGTGKWTQTGGPIVGISNDAAYNTTVTGLQPEQTYTFKWTITSDVCPSSSDEVTIYNRPEISTPNAGANQVFCSFVQGSANNKVKLNATALTRGYEAGSWAVTGKPAGSTYAFTSTTAPDATFSFSAPGNYELTWSVSGDASCPPKTATVIIEVYESPVSGGVITTTPNVCAGADIEFTLPQYTGVIDKWQYNPDPVRTPNDWRDLSETTATISFQNVQDTFDVRVIIKSVGHSSCPATVTTPAIRAYVSAKTIGGKTDKDETVCKDINSGSIKLTGHLGAVTGWQLSTDNGATWTDIGNANVTEYKYDQLAKTTWFRAKVKNGSCNEVYSDITKITVVEPVSNADAGSDQNLCNVTTTTLTANTPAAGETGAWKQIRGNATLDGENTPILKLTDLKAGIYEYTWTVSNGICPVKTSTVTVSISASAIGGTAGKDATWCQGNDDGNITLNGYYGAVVKWQSSIDNGTTWTDIANTTATLHYSGLLQTTKFRAVINNGSCTVPVYSTAATITIKPPVTAANAGQDQELCNSATATLDANTVASGETGTWTQVGTTPNKVVFTNANNPKALLTGLISGTYKFKWTIDNAGTCPASSDEVTIIIYPQLINKIDNTPVVVCEGQLIKITSKDMSGGKGTGSYVIQWQYSDDNQVTWKDFGVNATFADFSFIGSKTIYVRRHVVSGPCDNYSDPTEVTVQAGLANNILASNEAVCINTAAAEIKGSLPTGGDNTYLYVWEQSIDNGSTWTVIAGANSQNYAPGVLTQTTLYRRTVSTALCSGPQNSVSNTITKTVNPDAKAIFAALKTYGCAPFTIDAHNISATEFADRNATYTWKVDDKAIGAHAIFPGYTIVNEDESITVKLVAASLYGCKSDSMEMKFYSAAPAKPSFTVSTDNSCGPVKVKFTNTSPSSARMTYAWDFGNGLTSSEYDPGEIEYAIDADRKDKVYTAKLAVTTACTTEEFIVPITVKAPPKAAFTPSKTTGCSPFNVVFTNNSMGERTTYTWNFDDGSQEEVTTSTGQVAHTFVTYEPRTYKVKLVAANECGTDELIYNLVVSPNAIKLNMAVNGDERIGCAPLKVNFNNNTREANSFHWDFGDGNQLNTTAGIETVPHEFTQPGKYTIALIASNGCSDTTGYAEVEVLATPKVAFTAVPDEVCIGQTIHFRNESDPVTGITWNFGDGKTSTLNDPQHAYTAANTYNVTMEGAIQYSAGNVCKASVTKPVKVIASLPGDFTASALSGDCVPFTITFTNITKPSALTKWDFGDGSNATGDVVSHTYTANGDYTVTMEALHPDGCTYIVSKQVSIKGPEGQFTYDHGYICKDKAVRFEAFAIRTASYVWAFGDGDTLRTTDHIVHHSYKQSGVYIPSVGLTNGDCIIWLKGLEEIKVDYYQANFTHAQQQGCGNSVIAFQDDSRSAFGISSRLWDFGDGTTSTEINPKHTYTVTNTWQVKLTTYNVSGCSDVIEIPVYSQPHRNPKAAIVNNTTGCIQQEVLYTAVVNTEDPITLYSWTFENGATAEGEEVKNKYASSGIYQATLTVGTAYGCTDVVNSTISIYPTPVIGISKDVTICRGQSAQLGSSGATTMVWTPTDGLNCSDCATPVASPLETRQYVLSGMNSYGCVSSATVTVNVVQPSKVTVSPQDTICAGQAIQLKAEGAYRYSWTPANSLNASNIAAPVATPTLTTTYRVEGTDEKDCFRDVANVVVVVGNWPKVSLGPDKVLPTGTELQLAATVTNGPIKTWAWSPVKELSCVNCPTPVVTVKRDACYSVLVKNIFNCEATDTICITSFCENTQVFIPNAFVPTATSNNILMVRGKGIKQVKSFRIFNRWGQMVFDKANFPPNEKSFGWDGRVNGVPATPDVYVYTCEVICEDDKMFTYKGNVAILK